VLKLEAIYYSPSVKQWRDINYTDLPTYLSHSAQLKPLTMLYRDSLIEYHLPYNMDPLGKYDPVD